MPNYIISVLPPPQLNSIHVFYWMAFTTVVVAVLFYQEYRQGRRPLHYSIAIGAAACMLALVPSAWQAAKAAGLINDKSSIICCGEQFRPVAHSPEQSEKYSFGVCA